MYTCESTIRLGQTDAAGVMFFARYFDLAHVAFEEFMASIGHALKPELHTSTIAFPLVHVEADYRQPLRMGDDVEVDVSVARVSAGSFTLAYLIRRVRSQHNPEAREVPVASITTVHASADVPSKSAVRLPETLSKALGKHLEGDAS